MITQIEFPNTVADIDKTYYIVAQGKVDEIKPITKNGEMAAIGWFQVIKDGMIIAEVKESICDIHYKDYPAEQGF